MPVTIVHLTCYFRLLQSYKHSLQHKTIPLSKEKMCSFNSYGFYFVFFSIFEYSSECTLLHLECSRVWTVCQQPSSVLTKSATVFSSPLLKRIELLILMEQSCFQHYCRIGCRRYVWNLHSCHAVRNAGVKKFRYSELHLKHITERLVDIDLNVRNYLLHFHNIS